MSDDLWREVDAIPGWLSRLEAEQLYELCNGTWCEIGSWKGRSTYVLGSKHRGYAIDHFKGSPETSGVDTKAEFLENIKGLPVEVRPYSMEIARRKLVVSLQLLFLDGEHSYEATKLAFELYAPLVESGGYIVLHDVWGWCGEPPTFPGVTKFAYELLDNPLYEHAGDAQRSMAVRKL